MMYCWNGNKNSAVKYLFIYPILYLSALITLIYFSQTHVSLSGQLKTVDANEANIFKSRSEDLTEVRLWSSGILDCVVW
jgi:hypothetical protein